MKSQRRRSRRSRRSRMSRMSRRRMNRSKRSSRRNRSRRNRSRRSRRSRSRRSRRNRRNRSRRSRRLRGRGMGDIDELAQFRRNIQLPDDVNMRISYDVFCKNQLASLGDIVNQCIDNLDTLKANFDSEQYKERFAILKDRFWRLINSNSIKLCMNNHTRIKQYIEELEQTYNDVVSQAYNLMVENQIFT